MNQLECQDTLLEDIHRALVSQGYPHHRRLQVTVDKNVVRLEGCVPTFYLRQVALECVKKIPGVGRVIDGMQVADCSDQQDI